MARLANLVGDGNVGSPQLMDTHRPDAIRIDRFRSGAGQTPAACGKKSGAPRPRARPSASPITKPANGFRFFRPGLPVRVEMRDGLPARIFFQGMRGEVVAASGPWRTSGDWWQEAWDQAEWDVEVQFSRRHATKNGQAFQVGQRARPLSFVLRCAAARVVCAGNVRLMYTELHARSAFSFLEGASVPEELAERVRRTRHGRHGGAGSRRHVWRAAFLYGRAKNLNITRTDRRGSHFRGRLALSIAGGIARDGYQNLCRLITRMKMRAHKRRRADFCPRKLSDQLGNMRRD